MGCRGRSPQGEEIAEGGAGGRRSQRTEERAEEELAEGGTDSGRSRRREELEEGGARERKRRRREESAEGGAGGGRSPRREEPGESRRRAQDGPLRRGRRLDGLPSTADRAGTAAATREWAAPGPSAAQQGPRPGSGGAAVQPEP